MDSDIIPVEEIELAFRRVFPGLADWNPTDLEYQLVTVEELGELIARFPAKPWIVHKYECEEIAKAFVAQVREWEAGDEETVFNRAIGVASAQKLRGGAVQHTVNIALTNRGAVLFDLQTGVIWDAEPGRDEIYFVEM